MRRREVPEDFRNSDRRDYGVAALLKEDAENRRRYHGSNLLMNDTGEYAITTVRNTDEDDFNRSFNPTARRNMLRH